MRVTGSCDSEHDTGTRSCERAGREVAARGPARVLLVLDRVALTELVKLTLNPGVYATRTVRTLSDVGSSIAHWQPHLLILDMDLDGREILQNIGANTAR